MRYGVVLRVMRRTSEIEERYRPLCIGHFRKEITGVCNRKFAKSQIFLYCNELFFPFIMLFILYCCCIGICVFVKIDTSGHFIVIFTQSESKMNCYKPAFIVAMNV